ncbi:tellurite resistance TerB family protein [Neisseria sp. 23W00296]|uniref:tellurite resistance TerB family protein n=1 Tax=unclassified Neisseria TaxID=2623750 RepID=UPI003756B40C
MNFQNLLNQVLDGVQKTAGDKNLLGKIGGGTAAVGLASMLLGKKTRKNLLKTGSSAALGALAYHAYQSWQQSRNTETPPAQNAFAPQGTQSEDSGRLILKTMIAAAAADGSIDETERSLIEQESGSSEESQWLLAETRNPAAAAELAALAGGDTAAAAEAYLAARMVCGELSRKEIVFLSQLADAFRLDPQLVEQLERQAGF